MRYEQSEPRYRENGNKTGQARLCEARNKLGLPCRAYAANNTNPPRCTVHRHKQHTHRFKRALIDSNPYMSRWYKRHVGPKLQQVIEEAAQESNEAQFAVFEEIALMRDAAGQFAAIYSALIEAKENGVDVKQESIAVAATAMQQALIQVVDVCTKATKAHEKLKTFSALDIENICAQFTNFLWEVFRDEADRPKVEAFLQMMEERLVLPKTSAVEPTDLSVEDTAREMDNTVPYVKDEGI